MIDDDLATICLLYGTNDLLDMTDSELESLIIIGPIGPMAGYGLEEVLNIVRMQSHLPAWEIRLGLMRNV